MKANIWILTFFGLAAGLLATVQADSTINNTDKYAYGANIGWINFKHDQPAPPEGAVVGEFVCSGFVYSANCGWIHLGDGTPVNGVQYQNNAANDFGVNVTGHTSGGGLCEADLRGFAYGANIGWINFEALGDPRIDLSTGKFNGYAYSANCGWINLGEGGMTPVKTDTIQGGTDSDTDGIADAYELTHAGDLVMMNATSDLDEDGVSDLDESAADTDPDDAADRLQVTVFNSDLAPIVPGTMWDITFTSRPTRKYRLEKTDNLVNFVDAGFGLFAPDAGATTSKTLSLESDDFYWYRVIVTKPLAP